MSEAFRPIFSSLRPTAKPSDAVSTHEDGQARAAVLRVEGSGARDDQDEVGEDAAGDEGLGAVEDVVRAVLGERGARLDVGEVRAGAGLGHRDGRHEIAGHESGQPALLLFLVGVRHEVRKDQVGVHRVAAEGDTRTGCLLHHDSLILEALACAAELLRHLDTENAQLTESAVEVARRVALLLPLMVDGDDLLLHEVPQRRAERLMVLVEHRTAHGSLFSYRRGLRRRFKIPCRTIVKVILQCRACPRSAQVTCFTRADGPLLRGPHP